MNKHEVYLMGLIKGIILGLAIESFFSSFIKRGSFEELIITLRAEAKEPMPRGKTKWEKLIGTIC